jgi:uncharacterized protein (DUF1015 family)
VAAIKPFRALRPAKDKVKQVSSVPYDVVYESEVHDYITENPLSFLRITRPEEQAQLAGIENAEMAKRNLDEFVASGILIPDSEPSYYIYRLTAGDHTQTGIVACCSIDEYESGLIKKHEKTRPDKVADRTHHMLTVRAQTGLIFLAYRGTETINAIVDRITGTEPLYDFVSADGVGQTVWRAPSNDEITKAFSEVPSLYIADGHHRAESASLARKELRDRNPEHNGTENYNFVMAGLFPAEQLEIMAYNRVVDDLEDLSDADIIARISESFIVTETDRCRPETHGEICMYLGGKWYDLQFAVAYFREPDPIERLDVSILQHYVLEPVLGVADPRTDERIGFVGGIRGTKELEKIVDSGEARVAFSLYPTTMEDLFAVSDMGEIMPPKSTWFEPKLKDGLFVHVI